MESSYWKLTINLSTISLIAVLVWSCAEPTKELPVLGPYKVTDEVVEGVLKTDTVFTTVRPFAFTDQDGQRISHETIDGKIYVTDFFFTSCPTICPKMKQQLLRVYDRFQSNDEVLILSHSIDPVRDSVGRLKSYAEKLGIETQKWHLMTGERDSIYSMAKHYMIAAQKDDLAPGGFAHSGAFLLVDRNKQIRGIYDGTNPDEVDQMMADMEFLLKDEKTP